MEEQTKTKEELLIERLPRDLIEELFSFLTLESTEHNMCGRMTRWDISFKSSFTNTFLRKP